MMDGGTWLSERLRNDFSSHRMYWNKLPKRLEYRTMCMFSISLGLLYILCNYHFPIHRWMCYCNEAHTWASRKTQYTFKELKEREKTKDELSDFEE